MRRTAAWHTQWGQIISGLLKNMKFRRSLKKNPLYSNRQNVKTDDLSREKLLNSHRCEISTPKRFHPVVT